MGKIKKVQKEKDASSSFMYNSLKVEPSVPGMTLNAKKKKKKKLSVMLKDIQKKESLVEQIERQGDLKRATEMKMKDLWKTTLDKCEGKKLRDDAFLIKKTIKNVQKKKEKSRKEWQERKEQLDKKMEKRQEKRTVNIQRRKQAKKQGKTKRRK